MSKFGKAEQWRREGALWAFKFIKEQGMEAAEKEFEWRGITKCPLTMLDHAEIIRFQNEVKETCQQTMCVMSCLTLRDQFGFGEKRIDQFIERFNFKTECLVEDYATWSDYQEILQEELGIDIFTDPIKKRIKGAENERTD